MHKGTSIRVDRIDGDILTTTSGRFKFGPVPNDHKGHSDLPVPFVLIAADDTQPDASMIRVSIDEGCGCYFALYPQETESPR
jgi:hypothetical protein